MLIGIFLRHIKAYKSINFIPIGQKYNFVAYLGENGVGKSSILQAMDSFFNEKDYFINKSAISDGTSGNNFPYFTPIFLISKTKITKNNEEFEKMSDFFWSVKTNASYEKNVKEFFDVRKEILDKKDISKDTHYLFIIGEKSTTKQVYFGTFEQELIKNIFPDEEKEKEDLEKTLKENIEEENKEILVKKLDTLNKKLEIKIQDNYKIILKHLKQEIYSYVYVPVEIDAQDFTKIETDNIQKIIGKNLKDEINKYLDGVVLEGKNGLITKLDNFIEEIENILENKYQYHTGGERQSKISKLDLVEKILETYFQKRILHKKDGKIKKKISELSAGEKRQALIDLIYAFLKQEEGKEKKTTKEKEIKEGEKTLIIGIDEPENSLHTSLCYNQFEKLQKIAVNHQVLITTHWYGFLPIVSEGIAHFLSLNGDKIEFETYNLYNYRAKIKQDIENSRNEIPNDSSLKSTNDLVQSIFYSLKKENCYNWLICEGITEKIYFEYFFREEIGSKKLKILPVGGQSKVIEIYKYLDLPINEKNIKSEIAGKVFCLIDTDKESCEEIKEKNNKNLRIRRLSNDDSHEKTDLLSLDSKNTTQADMEQSLNPLIFQETINFLSLDGKYKINNIENSNGNTSFTINMGNFKLKDFFKENNGENKILFANKYIEIMKSKENIENYKIYIPNWISEIETFFGKE